MMRHLLSALALLGLLTGCSGSADSVNDAEAGDAAPPVTPVASLSVRMADCESAAVHDSGRVIYVVADRRCAAGGPRRQFSLGLAAAGAVPGDAVQLDMLEGDELDGITVPGLGLRRVGLVRAGQWRRFDNVDSWQHRDGAGLLLLDGELYLLGGWIWGQVTSEVWKSRDLVHWEFLGNAPWPARHGSAWLVHEHKLWVIGGDLYDDVWSSPDGVAWTQEASHAPFGPRYTPNAASVGGRIVVYGGQSWQTGTGCDFCVAEASREVWSSADGRRWQLANAQAPWQGRGLIHGSIVHDGEIFLVGGGLKAVPAGEHYSETVAERGDAWSSHDGVAWTRRSEALPFTPRTHFSVVATPQGCYVSDGSVGTQANVVNDLFFAADCVSYAPVPDTPPLEPRHASSLAAFNGSLVILGGPPAGDAGTTVWQYFP